MESLGIRCSGDHDHLPLKGGNRTKIAQQYPPQLCRTIVKSLNRQLAQNAKLGLDILRRSDCSFCVDCGFEPTTSQTPHGSPISTTALPQVANDDDLVFGDCCDGDRLPQSDVQLHGLEILRVEESDQLPYEKALIQNYILNYRERK